MPEDDSMARIPPNDTSYEYTWNIGDSFGLRLDIKDGRIRVLFLASSAPSKLCDIAGWEVTAVNGVTLTKENLQASKQEIKKERPLTLNFQKKTDVVADGIDHPISNASEKTGAPEAADNKNQVKKLKWRNP